MFAVLRSFKKLGLSWAGIRKKDSSPAYGSRQKMKPKHAARMQKFAIPSASWSPEQGVADVIAATFDISADQFLARYFGRSVLVFHGSRRRFTALIGAGLQPSARALRTLLPNYSQPIKR